MLPFVLIAYVLAPDATRHVLAQAASEAGPWLTLVNLGVGGIGLWAFTTGKIHSDKELQRVISRCDAEHQRIVEQLDVAVAELRANNREAVTSLVPTLTKATLLLGRFLSDNTPPPKGRQ